MTVHAHSRSKMWSAFTAADGRSVLNVADRAGPGKAVSILLSDQDVETFRADRPTPSTNSSSPYCPTASASSPRSRPPSRAPRSTATRPDARPRRRSLVSARLATSRPPTREESQAMHIDIATVIQWAEAVKAVLGAITGIVAAAKAITALAEPKPQRRNHRSRRRSQARSLPTDSPTYRLDGISSDRPRGTET